MDAVRTPVDHLASNFTKLLLIVYHLFSVSFSPGDQILAPVHGKHWGVDLSKKPFIFSKIGMFLNFSGSKIDFLVKIVIKKGITCFIDWICTFLQLIHQIWWKFFNFCENWPSKYSDFSKFSIKNSMFLKNRPLNNCPAQGPILGL